MRKWIAVRAFVGWERAIGGEDELAGARASVHGYELHSE